MQRAQICEVDICMYALCQPLGDVSFLGYKNMRIVPYIAEELAFYWEDL